MLLICYCLFVSCVSCHTDVRPPAPRGGSACDSSGHPSGCSLTPCPAPPRGSQAAVPQSSLSPVRRLTSSLRERLIFDNIWVHFWCHHLVARCDWHPVYKDQRLLNILPRLGAPHGEARGPRCRPWEPALETQRHPPWRRSTPGGSLRGQLLHARCFLSSDPAWPQPSPRGGNLRRDCAWNMPLSAIRMRASLCSTELSFSSFNKLCFNIG